MSDFSREVNEKVLQEVPVVLDSNVYFLIKFFSLLFITTPVLSQKETVSPDLRPV